MQVRSVASPIQGSALGDPADDSVWFGAPDAVVHYTPMMRQFDRIPVLDGVGELMFDKLDPFRGLYIRTRVGWSLVQRGSGVPVRAIDVPPVERRTTSTTVEAVLRRYPAADAMQALTMVGDGRRYRYTSAAVDAMGRNAFLGTNGAGLMRYEGLVANLEPLSFGLLADGVGAVTIADGGVWVGSTRSRRPATRYRPGLPGSATTSSSPAGSAVRVLPVFDSTPCATSRIGVGPCGPRRMPAWCGSTAGGSR